MIGRFSRRGVIGFLALAALPRVARSQQTLYDFGSEDTLEEGYDPALLPPPESETDYPVETVNLSRIPESYRRTIVDHVGDEAPGEIIVDTASRHLYLVAEEGKAVRYGIGVGKAGFAWTGTATIGKKRRWPRWVPPREMVARDANAAKWPNGQPGGPDNPLGARALYLYQGGYDTLYRIHGTNDPKSIGKAMSSGCVRLLNEDIADLFERVEVGAKVVVLAQG